MFNVIGKCVLVFGGMGGIGKSTIKALLTSGIKGIVVADLSNSQSEEFMQQLYSTYGKHKCLLVKVDVTKLDEVTKAFEDTINHFGALDIVINCAGISNEINYALTISVNLIGAMHITTESYKYLSTHKSTETDQAIIINVASIAGFYPLVNFPAYTASKFGIISFSYSIGKHKEMENDYSVKIITLCPGGTDTPMINDSLRMRQDAKPLVQEHMDTIFNKTHLQKPESVAKCILQIIRIGSNTTCWLSNNDMDAKQIDYEALIKLAYDMTC